MYLPSFSSKKGVKQMHRLVYNSFKAIMLSIIFVFVWDVGFYLFKFANLNQRMLLTMNGLVKTVEANNYLPSGQAETYRAILEEMGRNMNGDGDVFVKGFNWNYTNDNSGIAADHLGSSITVRTTMSTPANYGDIMVVYVGVGIRPVVWVTQSRGNGGMDVNKVDNADSAIMINYRYEVPCLHYVKQGTN